MRARFFSLALVVSALPFVACGSSGDASPSADAGDEATTIAVSRDAARHDVATPVDAKTPWDRMQPHNHRVLGSMRLQIVYLGSATIDFDAFVAWLLASDYWGILNQYGVGSGSLVGSVRLAGSSVIPDSAVQNGLITGEDLEAAVHDAIHPPAPDAGADADAAADGPMPPLIPIADAYIFFLPDGVNVNLGERGGHVFQTCIDAGGYHAYDGVEPYAVIPPCAFGRSPLAVSHELAEMATDPVPGGGWFSDKDADNSGGEIADLCNEVVPHGVEGWAVTQLWSNADGDCEPN